MFGTSLEEGVGREFELDMKSNVSIRMFAWTVPGHSCLFRGGMTWCLVWLVVREGGGGRGRGGNRKGSRWQLMQCTRCTLCAAPLVATPWEVDAWCQEVRRVNLFKRCSKHCKGHALILGSINFWLDQVSVFGRVFFRYCLQIMCEWWVGSHKWEEASPTPKPWFITYKYRIE